MFDALNAMVDLVRARMNGVSGVCRKECLETLRYFDEIMNTPGFSAYECGSKVDKRELEYIDSILFFVMHFI